MTRRQRSLAAPIAVIALLLLLPAAYMGAYYALVEEPTIEVTIIDTTRLYRSGPPHYHDGGEAAEAFFYPAYYFDSRVVRRNAWTEDDWNEFH